MLEYLKSCLELNSVILIVFKFRSEMEKKSIYFLSIDTKAQSKSEMYRALTIEGEFYLPLQNETTMQFISGIAFGEKKVCSFIRCSIITYLIGIAINIRNHLPGTLIKGIR